MRPSRRGRPVRCRVGPHDGASYLGPVILAKSGTSVTANYTNDLKPDDYKRVFTNPLGSSYEQFLRYQPPASGS